LTALDNKRVSLPEFKSEEIVKISVGLQQITVYIFIGKGFEKKEILDFSSVPAHDDKRNCTEAD
jgi:hypothetical protein